MIGSALTVIRGAGDAPLSAWGALLLLAALVVSCGLLLWVVGDMLLGDWLRSRRRGRR